MCILEGCFGAKVATNFNIGYYDESILLTLASIVGTSIKLNINTKDMKRGRFINNISINMEATNSKNNIFPDTITKKEDISLINNDSLIHGDWMIVCRRKSNQFEKKNRKR